jgi:hypothetical protein
VTFFAERKALSLMPLTLLCDTAPGKTIWDSGARNMSEVILQLERGEGTRMIFCSLLFNIMTNLGCYNIVGCYVLYIAICYKHAFSAAACKYNKTLSAAEIKWKNYPLLSPK